MTLRTRTLLTLGALFLSLILTLYLAFSRILLTRFRDLEEDGMRRDVERVRQAVQNDLAALSSTAKDWAAWDETYQFIRTLSPAYVEANLLNSSIQNLRLNLFCLADTTGRLVYGKALDRQSGEEKPVPPALREHFIPGDSLVVYRTTASSRTGILMLAGEPVLVACRPVITSLEQGPIRGTLVMGRFLNEAEIARYSIMTGLAVSFSSGGGTGPAEGEIRIARETADSLSGTAVLTDLYGRPALALSVRVPRTIYRHGQISLRYLLAAMVAVSAAYGLAVILLLERRVLSPLHRLHREVRQISRNPDLNRQLTEKGRDEFSGLARGLNEMLLALQESEEKFALFMRHFPGFAQIKDPAARLIFANEAMERELRARRGELLGKASEEIWGMAAGATVRALDIQVLARHTPLQTLEQLPLPEGKEHSFLTYRFPILRRGQPSLLGALSVDVTEKQKLEANLANLEKLESIGLLAGGIAHDFNNLLMGIFGYMEMARDQLPPDSSGRGPLEKALQVFHRAQGLTQQLLTFSRGGTPVKKAVALGPFLRDAVSFSLSGSAVASRLDVPEGLWPCEADESQLAQVVNNIVLNAVQAMPGGGTLTVGAENLPLAGPVALPLPDGPYVKISIRDTGGGIALGDLPRIFDPFFTTKQKGSGLGLTTAYSIVRKHGGHIQAESDPGRGAVFHIFLPALPHGNLAPAPGQEVPYRGQGSILVMDDEEFMRDVLRQMLQTLGFSATLTKNGEAALEAYREALAGGRPFAAAILDLTVPGGLGGRETLVRLREFHPAVKAVAVSGYSHDPVIARPGEFGFAAALKKPFTIRELGQTLQAVLA